MLVDEIKKSEGFVDHVYKDSLGIDTIGYGTKMPLSKEECELLLVHRLKKMEELLYERKPMVHNLSVVKRDVLFEMCYQMGVNGVLKFKKMWEALDNEDYQEASKQMLDSKWAMQTQARASRLAHTMRS